MDVTCTATAENVSVTFDKENIAEPNAANTAATIEDRYEKLSEQSKTDIKKVLFLLDKFSGSDELYHEFTQLYNNMPRSYMVAHYRRRMNASYDILSLPEPFEGTRMELAPLLADDICRLFAAANIEEPSNETVTVKISGDGAQFSSTSSFVLMTYCILFGATNTQASSSHMSFAALKGSETYETLRDGFKDVWTEINALIKDPTVKVGDKTVRLNIVFAADYKFLLLTMGMNKASARYACVWCKVADKDRHDMTKDISFYNTGPMARTHTDMTTLYKEKTTDKRLGSHQAPLLTIDLTNVVLDELHLLLRVVDRLLGCIICTAQAEDQKQGEKKQLGTKVKCIMATIKEHVYTPFKIWLKKNENGQDTSSLDWTSIDGCIKKKLLDRLPEHFPTFMDAETAVAVKVWFPCACIRDRKYRLKF
ncbi:uncharacterized protein LOC135805713 isoform X2 [Sycon ciliatum]|uniref:uncharacterized protein LOC135805713 isoform X2 n=1 Tax=Sycon ciliatum TaxID=27933 RepID=UPI0031F5F545